ncbi:MAG TPA: 5'-3' exonuclease H3TH domain-containing protein, partial [Candidatus Hydrogenedentes bacterium]|nr:5'-3' exonuclease H3TH domain-containing protein [Candidatus Hydrogenedentota bacterium]
MGERIFLVDAMAFAFRSFHAIKATLTDRGGRPTNAVYGFTRILMKLLREHNPTHIAVVFDAPGPTFRDELFPEYKATRRETPPELKEQFPRMHEVVRDMSLPLLCVPGVEADDVIGTLARRAEAAGLEAVLVSGDKDLLQLVSDRVRMFDPGKGESGVWYGPDEVRERFGTDPAHVVDALALIGDTADNVPGVRGIGDKTAQKLMAQYGSLEGLYEHLDDLKGKQRENLENDRDQAYKSRVLVTIKTDVALPESLEDLVRAPWDPERLGARFLELGFDSLAAETGAPAPEKEETPADYHLVLDRATLDRALAEMRAAGGFAVDTETTSIDPMLAALVGVSLSAAPGTGYYIPVRHTPEALTIRTRRFSASHV